MIKNYFTVAWRNILKNKTFSLINICGLAVSMSVGILLISMAHDLLQYDQFHEKKDRIYRVNTNYRGTDGSTVHLATTSVLAGARIKSELPEVEAVAILQHGFGGEFETGKKSVEAEGLWAAPSFFQVFSFKLLKGDPARALNEPNSVILTEKTAHKFFGNLDPMGKTLLLKNSDNKVFKVTGVMQDIPKFSHLQFEALGSFITIDKPNSKPTEWINIWSNYIYLTLRQGAPAANLQRHLVQLSERQNKLIGETKENADLYAQPLSGIAFGKTLENQPGPNISPGMFWFIAILSVIVILSACFNYTNLSIGRSINRSKEIGVRKLMGAKKVQLFLQLITEAVLIALIALVLAIGIFELIRPQFLSLNPNLNSLLNLDLSVWVVACFVGLATTVGIISGLLPGLFYTKLNVISVIRNSSPFKKFRHVSLKNALITFQFTVSLLFITSAVIAYKQYRDFISFNLGFNTSHILNLKLQGNDAAVVAGEVARMPEVTMLSKSSMVTSIGNNFYSYIRHSSADSSIAWYNKIDENYIPVLHLKLINGRNFHSFAENGQESEVIVNETLVQQLHLGKALGEFLTIDNKKLQIVGVVKDFHSNTVDCKIKPFLFRYGSGHDLQYLNIKLTAQNIPATMDKLARIWKNLDPVHPLQAKFYDESIEQAYSEYASMAKIIGYLSFLAVVIASLGLLGMVIISSESRRAEVSIRKVFGASTLHLLFLLGKNFLWLLLLSGLIALPVAYLVFEKIVLRNIVYHTPVGPIELFTGFVGVLTVALLLILSQTLKVALTNPAKVLRNE